MIKSGSPNSRAVDKRLLQLRSVQGMSEGIGADGGFLLQDNFSDTILQEVWNSSEILNRVTRIPLTKGNSIKIPGVDEDSRATGKRGGSIQVYWASEAVTVAASKPKFRELNLELKKLLAITYLTEELLEDVPAIEGYVKSQFIAELKFMIEDAILNGDGAGQPLGIMNSRSLVTVNKDTDQTANMITVGNVLNMWSRILPWSRANAVWLVNQDAETQLFTLKIGDTPVYLPAGGLSGTPYAMLLGRPVISCEYCNTLGTAGDIILCDLSQYVMIEKVYELMAKLVTSIHVRFVFDEMALKFVMRVDGQPKLSKAITPFKGTNTLSHAVTVETRE